MASQEYDIARLQAKILSQRMRTGTGVNGILNGEHGTNPTHYIDALQRFQKDYNSNERNHRDNEKVKRQSELERRRLNNLQRQNSRWERVEFGYKKNKDKVDYNLEQQLLGAKRSSNSNGLAYNPINLNYENNPEGDKLRTRDQDHQIRGFVRAHNMDFRGNSKYNPITGENRLGVDQVIPSQLGDRYNTKLFDHYDTMKLRVPASSNQTRNKANYNYF